MTSFPFVNKQDAPEERIRTDLPVFSADGIKIGIIEAVFSDSLITRTIENGIETKFRIPRLSIEKLLEDSITLKEQQNQIIENYQTSSSKKNWE